MAVNPVNLKEDFVLAVFHWVGSYSLFKCTKREAQSKKKKINTTNMLTPVLNCNKQRSANFRIHLYQKMTILRFSLSR